MAVYGDPGRKRFYVARPQFLSNNQMSTAIVRVLTAEGFVIAADGRQTDERDRVVTDSAQKIFPICDDVRQLSCALCGKTGITADTDENEMVWDLANEVQSAAQSVRASKSRDLAGYAVRLSRPIKATLEKAKRSGKIAEYPSSRTMAGEHGLTIAELLLDGYYDGVQSRVRVRFFHKDQKLLGPGIENERLTVSGYSVHGSDKIATAFFSQDPHLDKYWTAEAFTVSSISNAVALAHGYITACFSPEGRLIDHECPGIGGWIHIAAITPNRGFYWVLGYEPMPQ